MDELTPRASALGVVNAVKRIDGRLVGDATDGTAFLAASRRHGLDPAGARVAMVGGGATATAIAHACAEQGVAELVLSVRNTARHDALRGVVESVPNPPRIRFDLDSLEGFDLVINATSVGMNGDPTLPHPVDSLDPTSLVGRGRRRSRARHHGWPPRSSEGAACSTAPTCRRRSSISWAHGGDSTPVDCALPVDQAGLKADEHLVERGRRDVLGDEGIADVAHQDEAQLAALTLLVAMHRLDQRLDGHRPWATRLPGRPGTPTPPHGRRVQATQIRRARRVAPQPPGPARRPRRGSAHRHPRARRRTRTCAQG